MGLSVLVTVLLGVLAFQLVESARGDDPAPRTQSYLEYATPMYLAATGYSSDVDATVEWERLALLATC